jgi:hypothetical protein
MRSKLFQIALASCVLLALVESGRSHLARPQGCGRRARPPAPSRRRLMMSGYSMARRRQAVQITTDNIGDPRDEIIWKAYKRRFGKSFSDEQQERLHRTIFVRRAEYLKDLATHCRREPIVLDDRLDTSRYPIDEDQKVLVMKEWLNHHSYWELATYEDWQLALFTIWYFHREALRTCAGQDIPYSVEREQLLY